MEYHLDIYRSYELELMKLIFTISSCFKRFVYLFYIYVPCALHLYRSPQRSEEAIRFPETGIKVMSCHVGAGCNLDPLQEQ